MNGWLSGDVPQMPDVIPTLTDAVVTLRPPADPDLPRIVQACTDPEARAWLPLPAPYGEQQAREFRDLVEAGRARGERIEWAVESEGRWVGNIGLHDARGDTFEVGFLVHPDARGTGVCRRALQLLAAYCFDDLGLSGLAWRAARGNWGSRRVAWACGFTVDGTWPVPHPVSDGGVVQGMWVGHLDAGTPRSPRHPWYEPVILEGERVRLRPWREDDAPRSEPEESTTFHMNSTVPTPSTYDEWLLTRRERMATGGLVQWCISDPDLDEPSGAVNLRVEDGMLSGTGKLAYWLHPSARGLGILQEALDLVIGHAFAPRTDDHGRSGLGLHRLQAGTDIDNRPSARALRRAGFRQVAEERSVLARDGRPHSDALTFELLASDDRVSQTVEPAVVPELPTGRLTLRAWRQDDAPPEDFELDRASLRFMPPAVVATRATWDEWFARRQRQTDLGQYLWCITERETGDRLGSVTVFDREGPVRTRAELGYWLYPSARGHGYAGEAVQAVLDHAFTPLERDGLGLSRIEACTDAENLASQNLLRSKGFREWGQARANYSRADGSVSDSTYFELLAADHRAPQSETKS